MVVEVSYDDIGVKAAEAGKKLVAGEKATVDAPEGELFLNAKSADHCGLTLGDKLKKHAAKIYE